MSTNNQISVDIPQEVIKKATDMLQELKKMFAPYLQGLTNEERGQLFKMGDKTVATVSKVKSYLDWIFRFKVIHLFRSKVSQCFGKEIHQESH